MQASFSQASSSVVQSVAQGAAYVTQGATHVAQGAVSVAAQGTVSIAQGATHVAQGAVSVAQSAVDSMKDAVDLAQGTLNSMQDTGNPRGVPNDMTKLSSTFRKHDDQSLVAIYKNDSSLCYYVVSSIDKESYHLRNGAQFFSTEPILPKEHLRMQQLMIREKRERCLFCISYNDIEEIVDVIPIELDEFLFTYLSHELR